jgi:hypothetical protein
MIVIIGILVVAVAAEVAEVMTPRSPPTHQTLNKNEPQEVD